MDQEIRRVDPEHRRRAIVLLTIFYAAAAVFGVGFIGWGRPWLQDCLAALEPHRALRLLSWALSLACLSFLPLAAFIYFQGHKIIVSACYPAPGTKVIRDTEVIRGPRAVSRGRLLVKIAWLLAALALLAAAYLPYWLNDLAASRERLQRLPRHGLLVEQSAVSLPSAT